MTDNAIRRRSAIAGVTLIAVTLPLAACGGSAGGGVVSTPVPPSVVAAPPPAPPPPPPAPPPTPTALEYSQAEYDRSNGATSINAAVAYKAGFNGAGITVGVVDSGIDQEQIEFSGRLSPLSRDFAGNASVQDEEGHGTSVAGVIAAAANDRNTLGVAWGSTILALRTDRPGSCAETGADKNLSGCKHPDSAIGAAVDFARQNGAKVINISLGGGAAGPAVRSAVGRATAADIIIVISAGNDGDDATKNVNPDPFAQVALDAAAARGLVIIAGALAEDNSTLAPFSNRAGFASSVFLTALGTRVLTVNNKNQAVLASGTSFAAPIISGAVALIRQAFPNLTGTQVVDLIYRTARDLGATGIDDVYGRGGLDLTRAFQPQGALTLAGSSVVLGSLDGGQLGSAMGDGGRMAGVSAVALDDYGRAYSTQVAGGARAGVTSSPFAAALRDGQRTAGLRAGNSLIAVSVEGATGARPLSLRQGDAIAARATALAFVQRLDAKTSVRLGIARGADGLSERLDAAGEGAFLLAGRADRQSGLLRDPDAAASITRQLGGLRLTAAAESGRSLSRTRALLPTANPGWDRSGYSSLSVIGEGRLGSATLLAGATRMSEDAAILGARLGPAVGAGRGADSVFLDAGAALPLGDGFRVGGAWRQGWTTARAGGALTGGTLRTNAWSFDAGKEGLWGDDRLSFRLSQPLRVTGGGLRLSVPTGYDYATLTARFDDRTLNLSPLGAERTAEAAYERALWGGRMSLNGWWRTDPGNNAYAPNETGALLKWSAEF